MLNWIVQLFFPSFTTRSNKILTLFNRSIKHMEKINEDVVKDTLRKAKAMEKIVSQMKANEDLSKQNAKVISNFKKLLAFDEPGELDETKESIS